MAAERANELQYRQLEEYRHDRLVDALVGSLKSPGGWKKAEIDLILRDVPGREKQKRLLTDEYNRWPGHDRPLDTLLESHALLD